MDKQDLTVPPLDLQQFPSSRCAEEMKGYHGLSKYPSRVKSQRI